jgi:hypothetical protein
MVEPVFLLEPLGAQQRDQEVKEQQDGDERGQNDHECLLNLVAGVNETKQQAECGQTQEQQGWYPNSQVHVFEISC